MFVDYSKTRIQTDPTVIQACRILKNILRLNHRDHMKTDAMALYRETMAEIVFNRVLDIAAELGIKHVSLAFGRGSHCELLGDGTNFEQKDEPHRWGPKIWQIDRNDLPIGVGCGNSNQKQVEACYFSKHLEGKWCVTRKILLGKPDRLITRPDRYSGW